MARVFEDFVRNFYKIEQQRYKIEPLTLKWDATPINISNTAQLPNMRTDVFLKSDNDAIIIDTKFYKNAFQSFHDTDIFNSNNLYQIFTYLEHYTSTTGYNHAIKGILLYPTVNFELNESFLIKGKSISIMTVDLNQHWQKLALVSWKLLSNKKSKNITQLTQINLDLLRQVNTTGDKVINQTRQVI